MTMSLKSRWTGSRSVSSSSSACSGLPAVICGHRENLSEILEEACSVLGAKAPETHPLPLGGFWVLQAGGNALVSREEHHLTTG